MFRFNSLPGACALYPGGLSRRMQNKRFRRLLWCIGGLFLVVLAATAVLAVSGLRERVFPADVAVVLGNEVYRSGHPAPRLAARLDRAVDLYRQGLVKTVIVSGSVGKSGVDEATAMREYLLRAGVPAGAIVADPSGANTRLTAVFTAAYLREQGQTSAIAVSQFFHLPRSRLAFEQEGVPLVGSAAADYFEWRDVYSTLRELPGYLAYLARLK